VARGVIERLHAAEHGILSPPVVKELFLFDSALG
jgi:hypothetical protein